MWICFRHLFFVDGLNCIAIQNVQAEKRFRTFQQLQYYLFLSLLTCQLTIFISICWLRKLSYSTMIKVWTDNDYYTNDDDRIHHPLLYTDYFFSYCKKCDFKINATKLKTYKRELSVCQQFFGHRSFLKI